MKGDIIIVEEHHKRAAKQIVDRLEQDITNSERSYTITVAGESGSGKSETGKAIQDELGGRGISAVLLQQDDYFVLPPKSNDAKRREDISWVGMGEVKLELLDEHLQAARDGREQITKPLVDYDGDRIDEENMTLAGARVVIAEGTYTTMLEHVDARVFINRNRLETMEARKKRAREAMDPFIEEVLKIEHAIIAPQKERAHVVISKDYEVSFR